MERDDKAVLTVGKQTVTGR